MNHLPVHPRAARHPCCLMVLLRVMSLVILLLPLTGQRACMFYINDVWLCLVQDFRGLVLPYILGIMDDHNWASSESGS